MPNRILKETICTSEDIAKLSPGAEILFYRLLVKADDFGAYYGNENIVKSACFPLISDDINCDQVEEWLRQLVKAGLIYHYTAEDGRKYIQFVKWEKHQQIRAKKHKFPAFDSNRNQLISNDINCSRNPIQSNTIQTESETESEPGADAPKEEPPAPSKEKSNGFTRIMEAWNSLGLSSVTKIAPGTERYNLLNKRLKDYGEDEILRAIENVRNSPFLTGNGSTGWTATFDWFIKPNNFQKVLDGNYLDRPKQAQPQAQAATNTKKYSTGENYVPPTPKAGSQEQLMKHLQTFVDQI